MPPAPFAQIQRELTTAWKQIAAHEETIAQQNTGLQQLFQRLQELNAQLLGERTTVKIFAVLNGGSITAPKAIIDELGARPYAYDATLSKDADTGDQTITVTKKSNEAIAEIEAQLKARQEAIEQAQREQEEKANEESASAAIVAPDGRPARESAGKLVVVH